MRSIAVNTSRFVGSDVNAAVYAAIDGSGGFYRNEVTPAVRSRMNVPFFLPDAALDTLAREELAQLFLAVEIAEKEYVLVYTQLHRRLL